MKKWIFWLVAVIVLAALQASLRGLIGAYNYQIVILVGINIILESVMSYFGFGIQPPDASWGSLVSDGQGFFDVAPWLVIVPGLLIFLTVPP